MIRIVEKKNPILGEYDNGNYHVTIYEDGTKVRETFDEDATEFIAEYPECMDVKITNKCVGTNCAYCHENSGPDGEHGKILTAKFWDSLKPYTEIALGGGDTLEHPDLVTFLIKLKNLKLIPNMTVNQIHFMQNWALLKFLCEEKLIYGLGISLVDANDEFIAKVKEFPNAVIHIINGIVTKEQLEKLANNDLKVLILGYKNFRRGVSYLDNNRVKVEMNKMALYDYLPDMLKEFKVVSFDNLALEQLEVKRLLTDEEWNEFYMGNDGKFTMYIDLVKEQFALCSVAEERFGLLDDIKSMFEKIKSLNS